MYATGIKLVVLFCILAFSMSEHFDIQSNSTQPMAGPVRYAIKPLGENAKCNGDHEFCCEAPSHDANNCPDSARTKDCDAKGACCCA